MKTNVFRKYADAPSIKARVWKLICKKVNKEGYAELSYADFIDKLHLTNGQKPSVQKALKLLKKDGRLTIEAGKSYQKSKLYPVNGVNSTQN